MLFERFLRGLAEVAREGDPCGRGELAVAQHEIVAAGIEDFRIAKEVVHDDVRRLQVGETALEALDVAHGVVVADAGVEHLDVLAVALEHLLQARGHGFRLWDAPAEGDRAAEEEDAALARRGRRHWAAAKPALVDADLHRLQHRATGCEVLVAEDRDVAAPLELERVAPHLDVVVLHRGVLGAQDGFSCAEGDEGGHEQHGQRGEDAGDAAEGHQSTSNFAACSCLSAGSWSGLASQQSPTASASISVPMKQRKASSGVHTIGSPRTLKLGLTTTGQPVRCLNAEINAWKRGLVSRWTGWIRAE